MNNTPYYIETHSYANLPAFARGQCTGGYQLYAMPGSCMYPTWAGYVVDGQNRPFSDFDQTHLVNGNGWYLVGLTLKP